MKKLFILSVGIFCQLGYSNEIDIKQSSNLIEDGVDPVMCCTRGTTNGAPYGSAGYVQVRVTRCATSTISYQDAQARACVLAEASADRALEIAQAENNPVIVG